MLDFSEILVYFSFLLGLGPYLACVAGEGLYPSSLHLCQVVQWTWQLLHNYCVSRVKLHQPTQNMVNMHWTQPGSRSFQQSLLHWDIYTLPFASTKDLFSDNVSYLHTHWKREKKNKEFVHQTVAEYCQSWSEPRCSVASIVWIMINTQTWMICSESVVKSLEKITQHNIVWVRKTRRLSILQGSVTMKLFHFQTLITSEKPNCT